MQRIITTIVLGFFGLVAGCSGASTDGSGSSTSALHGGQVGEDRGAQIGDDRGGHQEDRAGEADDRGGASSSSTKPEDTPHAEDDAGAQNSDGGDDTPHPEDNGQHRGGR